MTVNKPPRVVSQNSQYNSRFLFSTPQDTKDKIERSTGARKEEGLTIRSLALGRKPFAHGPGLLEINIPVPGLVAGLERDCENRLGRLDHLLARRVVLERVGDQVECCA